MDFDVALVFLFTFGKNNLVQIMQTQIFAQWKHAGMSICGDLTYFSLGVHILHSFYELSWMMLTERERVVTAQYHTLL